MTTAPAPPPGAQRYPAVFSPLDLAGRTLRNRLVIPAHSTNLGEQGAPTERTIAYYRERARGGAALVVIGGIRIHPTTISTQRALQGWRPELIPDFARLARAVKDEGALIIGQLLHTGRETTSQETGSPLWSASGIPSALNREQPHAMDEDEIATVIGHFALAARHLLEAGFDGVEIHGAHGYLLQQFLSPWSNVRTDQWGGSLENRLRFPRAVIRAVRDAADGAIVGLRISGDEFVEGGLGLADMEEITPRLLEAAPLDYLSVSHCTYEPRSFVTMIPDMHQPKGAYVYLAAALRKVTPPGIPVITVGRILDAAQAEAILQAGEADLVALARATIADPHLPAKTLAGEEETIIPCVSCNQGCVGMAHAMRPIRCLQNPVTGAEWRFGSLPRAAQPRRVLVIGGGVAGMEAALTARHMGHDVTLWEDTAGLGGYTRWAAMPRDRDALSGAIRYRKLALRRAGVHVRLGCAATPEKVADLRPDVVILATGANPVPYPVPGFPADRVIPIENLIIESIDPGQRIVFLDDDGTHRAAGVAEDLARKGKDLVIVTPLGDVGELLIAMSALGVRQRLADLGVPVHSQTAILGVDAAGLVLRHRRSGVTTTLPVPDSIVVAGLRVPRDDLAAPLRQAGYRVLLAGDAAAPRTIMDAISDGYRVARRLEEDPRA